MKANGAGMNAGGGVKRALAAAVGLLSLPLLAAAPYPWRGYMLDTSRHFFTVGEIVKTLDTMAAFKLNVFHWHLVDREGWRMPVRAFPKLTGRGAWRRINPSESALSSCWRDAKGAHGVYGPYFYTREQIGEVLAHAKRLGIRVVPEIEIPGHETAAIGAYPELGCAGLGNNGEFCLGDDAVIRMLERILDEVLEVFPDEVVHIGGDECARSNWRKCPKCQARIRALGLKDEKALQGWATRHFAEYLSARGRRAMGWQEIVDYDLPSNVIIQSYAGTGAGVRAAKRGLDAVMAPGHFCYLDYDQGLANDPCEYVPFTGAVPAVRCARFDPAAGVPPEARRHILGGEGCCWTESAPTLDVVEWRSWPRMAALAHALNEGPAADESAAKAVLADAVARLRGMKVNCAPYEPLAPDPPVLSPKPRKCVFKNGYYKLMTNELSFATFNLSGRDSRTSLTAKKDPSMPAGSYRMKLQWHGSCVTAADDEGLRKALAVLRQLAMPKEVGLIEFRSCEIEDGL